MAINADSVTVELIAKTEGYNAKINAAATNFEKSMARQSAAEQKAAQEAERAAQKRIAAEESAQRRIAEAAEKSRIRLQEAAQKAAIQAESAAARKAAADEAAAARSQAAADRLAAKLGSDNERAAAAAERAAARRAAADEAAAQRRIDAEQRAAAASAQIAAREAATAQRRSRLFDQVSGDSIVQRIQRQGQVAEQVSGRVANAQRNLGRQVADVGASLASGSSPFVILAQQAGQVADALADTGGKAAKVAAFFAGPLGAALLAAGSLLGVFVGKALEGGDSIEGLTKKLEENSNKARMGEAAQAIFAKSLEGTADASAKLVKQLAEQNRSQLQVAQSALAAATALRQQSIQNLRAEASRAAIAVGTLQAANSIQFGAGGVAGAQAGQKVAADQLAAAKKRVALANKALADSEKAVVEASIPILRLQGAENADKTAAATGKHTREVDKLTNAYRKAQAAAAKLGGAAGNAARAEAVRSYREGIAKADKAFDASKDSIRDTASSEKNATRTIARAEKTLADLRKVASTATGATRDRLVKQIDRQEKRVALLKEGIGTEAANAATAIGKSGAGEAAKRARETKKLIKDIRDDAVDALADIDRLYGLKSKNNFAGFKQIFGEEGVDYPSLGLDKANEEIKAEVQLRGQAREKQFEKDKQNVQSLAALYQSAFEGGVGSIWDTFKKEGLEAIAIVLAKLTIGKSLGEAFGAAQSGLFGGLLAGARASGGNVVAGKLYKVNENGPELFQPAQSGKIYPTGAIGKARSAGGGPTIVQQSFTLDARGGVVTEDLLRSVNTIATQRAAQAGQAAYQNSPARAARLQQLGT